MERFRRRGSLLAHHMRAVKHAKGRRPKSLPEHVRAAVARMNARHAVRAGDVVDVDLRGRPKVVRGRGAWKRWLPTAILRACFGIRPPRVRKSKLPSPLTASARCIAGFYSAGHSYVKEFVFCNSRNRY